MKKQVYEINTTSFNNEGYIIKNRYTVVYENQKYIYCKVNGSCELLEFTKNFGYTTRVYSLQEFIDCKQEDRLNFFVSDDSGFFKNHVDNPNLASKLKIQEKKAKAQSILKSIANNNDVLKSTQLKVEKYIQKKEELEKQLEDINNEIKELVDKIEE